MNETIFFFLLKDTSLLLDEDIELLRKHQIPTPLSTTEQLGVHHNDILKAFLQPSYSMTFSYALQTLSGEARLPSSLYKQLNDMFHFKPFMTNQFLSLDDYYLMGGLDQNFSLFHSIWFRHLSFKRTTINA